MLGTSEKKARIICTFPVFSDQMFVLLSIFVAVLSQKVLLQPVTEIWCPDCHEFWTEILPKVYEQVGSIITIQPNFKCHKSSLHKYGYECNSHTSTDPEGYIELMCASAISPSKFFDFNSCIEKDTTSFPDNVEGCCKTAGIDYSQVESCTSGEQGKQLIEATTNRTSDWNIKWVPTIWMDDKFFCIPTVKCEIKDYSDISEWVKYICSLYKGPKIPACE